MTGALDIDDAARRRPSTSHERGKSLRRRAILDAAREIISHAGDQGMTMRAMAAMAGVSPATPYNLFGSKQAILQALYAEDHAEYTAYFDERASTDPIIKIFDLFDISIHYLQRRPDFSRALLASIQRNADVSAGVWAPRASYVSDLIADCIAIGDLAPDTPAILMGETLVRLFKSASQEWVEGVLTLDQMIHQLGFALGLILSALGTPRSAGRIAEARKRYTPEA